MINQTEFSRLSNEWDVVLPPYEAEVVAFSRNAGEQFSEGHELIGIKKAFNKTKGEGIAIAILDTAGTFAEHPDLKDNSLERYAKNFTNSSSPKDAHGHGTHCAGIAAAVENNTGVIGAAPKAKLIAVKVLNDNGAGSFTWIAEGVKYIADLKIPGIKKKVISLSLGGDSKSRNLELAIKYAIAKGCYVVAAAGNSGFRDGRNTIQYPAKFNEVIAVGSINSQFKPSSFSSGGQEIDVAAPGERILSTHRNGGYVKLGGTSMATPLVAGIIALLASEYGDSIGTQGAMHDYLRAKAKDIWTPGFDVRTGAGVPMVSLLFEGGSPPPPVTTRPPVPTPRPDPDNPPNTTKPPSTTRPPTNPGTQRTLNLAMDGPFTVAWQTQRSRSNTSAAEIATTVDMADDMAEIQISANVSSQQTLKITRIEFERTTTNNAALEYDNLKAEFRRFFTNRGLVLKAGNDYYDALFWTRHFLQVTLRSRRKNIKVTYIHGVDQAGREAFLEQ